MIRISSQVILYGCLVAVALTICCHILLLNVKPPLATFQPNCMYTVSYTSRIVPIPSEHFSQLKPLSLQNVSYLIKIIRLFNFLNKLEIATFDKWISIRTWIYHGRHHALTYLILIYEISILAKLILYKKSKILFGRSSMCLAKIRYQYND